MAENDVASLSDVFIQLHGPGGFADQLLYFRRGNLACRRCSNASRAYSKEQRPALQAKRLKHFLEFKPYMSQRNRQRIKAPIPNTPREHLNGKRLSHHSIQLPQGNYGTRGAMHWR
jgi:hypothetical protein